MKWNRFKLDTPDAANRLRNLINSEWKYRSHYIDREISVLVVPTTIPESFVIEQATKLGLVVAR